MSTEPKNGRSAYFNKLNKNIGAEVIPLLLIRHKMSNLLEWLHKPNLSDSVVQTLSKIFYGTISIQLPNNHIHNFTGKFPGPNADIHIKTWQVINDYIAKGSIGFGEAYINALWDTTNLPNLMHLIAINEPVLGRYYQGDIFYSALYKFQHILKFNSKNGSNTNIAYHYDLGNEFYSLWLDKSMTYSGALFAGNENISLEEAQKAKYDRIITKLDIKSGELVLDIGCGFGAFAEFLAKKDVNVLAITLSEAQAQFATERIVKNNMQKNVNIRLLDYRNITGIFDHIVSIGMFEHVGKAYWPIYFRKIATHLKKGGTAMIQTIVMDETPFLEESRNASGFLQSHIFPGSFLPSHNSFMDAAKRMGLECVESFAFGKDYAVTLEHWLSRFDSQLPQIKKLGFDEKFVRMWRFYFCYARTGFLSGRINLVQFKLRHHS